MIGRRLERLPAYRKARAVMFFVTHGSEVITEPMIERSWMKMKDVVVPRVHRASDRLHAARIASIEKDLEIGTFGVREPKKTCRRAGPGTIDLVIVPGLAFDRAGHRLGYGKGYYDRWLKKIPAEKRIGVCFEFQVVDRLPSDGHDVPVAAVITERRTIRTTIGMR